MDLDSALKIENIARKLYLGVNGLDLLNITKHDILTLQNLSVFQLEFALDQANAWRQEEVVISDRNVSSSSSLMVERSIDVILDPVIAVDIKVAAKLLLQGFD